VHLLCRCDANPKRHWVGPLAWPAAAARRRFGAPVRTRKIAHLLVEPREALARASTSSSRIKLRLALGLTPGLVVGGDAPGSAASGESKVHTHTLVREEHVHRAAYQGLHCCLYKRTNHFAFVGYSWVRQEPSTTRQPVAKTSRLPLETSECRHKGFFRLLHRPGGPLSHRSCPCRPSQPAIPHRTIVEDFPRQEAGEPAAAFPPFRQIE
jgi:hypothetical protein